MSLTGLFLCLFLLIHLVGNLQLLLNDGGAAFNAYSEMMSKNPFIKAVSFILYFSILLHTVRGILLWQQNRAARGGVGYAVKKANDASFASRNMALLGSLMFIFIAIHMAQFWYQFKFGDVASGSIAPYDKIATAFEVPWIAILYVVAQIAIAFHLWHGFQSAFQTLGLNHSKYTPMVKGLGYVFSILVPLGFAIIPLKFLLG